MMTIFRASHRNTICYNRYFLRFIVGLFMLFSSSFLLAQQTHPVMGHEARQASWKQHVQLRENSIYKDFKWRAVGPELQGG